MQSVQILQMKMTSHGRQPTMEVDLKILKAEYLSQHQLIGSHSNFKLKLSYILQIL